MSNPSEDKNKLIVVLLHGFATGKDNLTNQSLVKILDKNQISTFRFDFFGHGESEGKIEELTFSEGVRDALGAIDYLKSQGYSKIGLMGTSFGGLVSFMVASKLEYLEFVALKSPTSNYQEQTMYSLGKEVIERWKNDQFRFHTRGDGKKIKINYTFFEDGKNNNGHQVVKKIKTPVLIIHGDQDKVVPIKQSIKTSQILSNGKLEIIKGAGHTYDEPGTFDQMIDLITKFIIKHSK